ncbi:FtsQ-type POTRA domain-containing protein [Yaniella flava]|uniref:FtsQ-type POTRA domain-containing protein n=1 Tax=Yaniella flava TaxID=287930 RepID=A0ABN2UQ44_9MICC
MPTNTPDDHDNQDKVAKKFPGLAEKKPVKSISVERPVDSDEKTVTETNLDADSNSGETSLAAELRMNSKPVAPSKHQPNKAAKASDAPTQERTESDETVLELPPSPEQRKAKRRRTIWISIVSAAVLVIGGWALLFFSPILAIDEIQHEGLDLVTQTEAEERTAELEGRPLPQVGEGTVTELFESNPAVDDVTLRAEPPSGLVVIVNEYTPIAMSPREKGYVVFSEDGTELAEITSQKAQEFELPVVASAADVADEDVFNTITEVLGSLPEDLRDQVRAASGSSIDSIELELTSGRTVMWGNSEEAEQKVNVLQALLGLDDEQSAEISEYDVSAPDFPVTR